MINKYGLDVCRLYILYKAAPQDDLIWDEKSITGMERFLSRIRALSESPLLKHGKTVSSMTNIGDENIVDLFNEINKYYENFAFNQVIGSLMKLINYLEHLSSSKKTEPMFCETFRFIYESFLVTLYPLCPKISEELLFKLNQTNEMPSWPQIGLNTTGLSLEVLKCIVNVSIGPIF